MPKLSAVATAVPPYRIDQSEAKAFASKMFESRLSEELSQLKEELPGTRILALTMHDDEEFFFAMLRAGASGYILKHSEPQERDEREQSERTRDGLLAKGDRGNDCREDRVHRRRGRRLLGGDAGGHPQRGRLRGLADPGDHRNLPRNRRNQESLRDTEGIGIKPEVIPREPGL